MTSPNIAHFGALAYRLHKGVEVGNRLAGTIMFLLFDITGQEAVVSSAHGEFVTHAWTLT